MHAREILLINGSFKNAIAMKMKRVIKMLDI
jgi:hypothetical protein